MAFASVTTFHDPSESIRVKVDGEQHAIDVCNGANGNTLATLTGYSPVEARVNARLIAAAPELYEALSILLVQVKPYEDGDGAAMYHAQNIARDALAKAVPAEGEAA